MLESQQKWALKNFFQNKNFLAGLEIEIATTGTWSSTLRISIRQLYFCPRTNENRKGKYESPIHSILVRSSGNRLCCGGVSACLPPVSRDETRMCGYARACITHTHIHTHPHIPVLFLRSEAEGCANATASFLFVFPFGLAFLCSVSRRRRSFGVRSSVVFFPFFANQIHCTHTPL